MTTKLKIFNTLLALTLSQNTLSSTSDLMKRRGGLKKPKQSEIKNQSVASTQVQGTVVRESSSSQASTYQCTKNDQDSIPFQDFLQLVEASELEINHDPNSGRLRIDGGKMINNCSSMLEYKLYQPNNDSKYLFKVEIRKPSNCKDGMCKYKAYTAEAGIANGEEDSKQVTVPPTLEGFYECLKQAGVYDEDNNYQAGKVALQEFVFESSEANETGEIVFYSHGPVGKQTDAVYSKKIMKGGSCDDFEEIQNGGYFVYSKEQTYLNNKNSEFQNVCKSDNYSHINSQINNFKEFKGMQKTLIALRDEALKAAARDLRVMMDENSKDLSELDASHFNQVTADFLKYIIEPLREKIEDKYYQMNSAKSKKEKIKLENELSELTAELMGYYKGKYLTLKEYELMKSFTAKAPLEQEEWRQAAKNYYEGNAIGLAYARYNKKYRESKKLSLIRPNQADKEVDGYYKTESKMIDMLGELAEDPKKSHAKTYNNQIIDLNKQMQLNSQDFNAFVQDEQQYMYETCYNQSFYWMVDRQGCANNIMANIQEEQYYYQDVNQSLNQMSSNYSEKANMWAAIEAQRNGGQVSNSNQQRSVSGIQNFTFDLPSGYQATQNQNQNYTQPWATNYQTNQQVYQQPSYYSQPATSFMFNAGGNINTGSNTNNGYYLQNQQQMPQSMQQYQMNNTTTGAMNFFAR